MKRRIVIMGASSGIGLAAARAFASRGVPVGLAARRTEPLIALQQEFPDCQIEVAAIDINSPAAVEGLQDLIARLGGMDLYFHVAGIGYDNPPLAPEREVNILETNVCGFARMVSTAYRYFRARGRGGHIAAITSVAGTKGIGTMSAYSASKKCAQTYLDAFDQLSRIERAKVTFTDIRPGWIETPLLHSGKTYPLVMTLDHALPLILKAIARRRRVAYIDTRWLLLSTAWRSLPTSLWRRLPLPL